MVEPSRTSPMDEQLKQLEQMATPLAIGVLEKLEKEIHNKLVDVMLEAPLHYEIAPFIRRLLNDKEAVELVIGLLQEGLPYDSKCWLP